MDYPYPWLKSYPPGVPEHLEYPPVALPDLLKDAARDYPEKEALSFYDNPVTYSAFYGYASRFAAALVNLGVRKGDRVAIMGPNCPQWEIAFFGALMAGAVVVQTNPMYRGRELTFLFNDSGAATVIVYKPLLPLILATKAATAVERVVAFDFGPSFQPVPTQGVGQEVEVFEQLIAASPNLPLPAVGPNDLAILQYTGGTTGDPKGVMLTHRNLVVNTLQALAAMTPLSPRKGEEVILTVLPLFHVYGMTAAMNLAVALAAKQVVLPRFETAEVLAAIAKQRVTYFPGAPTMYVAVNNYPGVEQADISSVKGCLSGSAPLPPEVQRRFEELTGATLVEGYGLSEASPVTHLNPLGGVRPVGKIGLPVSDTEARIVDAETGIRELGPGEVGELVVRGPQVMRGYWNKPQETAAALRDGWLFTGDLATMDKDGFFAVVDRKKDLIIAGGFNIYPREVEDVIYEHPKVKETAVVGLSDPYRGETVKAFVVLKENESLSAEELISFLRERIAAFKVPRQVEFRGELPKTIVGKALRRVLREESEGQARKGTERRCKIRSLPDRPMTLKPIRKAAVLGAGVMGSAIAAHLANVGVPTLLLDIVPPGEESQDRAKRDRLAAAAIERLKKTKPSPLYLVDRVSLITPGNLEDDLGRLAEVDWVIEAVVENLALKKELLGRVAASVRPDTIISTNTSGLPVNAIAEALPESAARCFLGTHFFNPPRYMRLLEIIPGKACVPEVVDYMKDFGYRVLGKGVVVAKDTPNFIANRIGTYGMMDTLRATLEEGFTIEEVDALTGPILGRPKSASFRTLDMVGVDILWHVAQNTFDALPDGPEREAFRPPDILEKIVAQKRLGDKTGGGFYRKEKSGIAALDLASLEYRPKDRAKLPALEAARQLPDPASRIKALLNSKDRAGRFVWRLVRNVLLYALKKWEELAYDIVSVDQAMRWGFNWSMGPFELWDAIGVEYTVKRLTAEGMALPAALARMMEAGVPSFYRTEGGTRYVYNPATGESQVLATRPDFVYLPALKATGKTVFENSGASLVDLGDGVACLEFHSKENAIGADIEQMIQRSVKEVEANFAALVLANHGRNFSVGANLVMILMEAEDDNWDLLDAAVRQFQNAGLALKYCLRPVVAAPFQMALGGGLEMCLASDRVQALAESYLGLVEVGVGLLPAGGGVKEMLFRAMEHVPDPSSNEHVDPVPFVARAFENIATARVSTSGPEAVKLGYLRQSDQITTNPDRLIYEAKETALGLARSGYRAPNPGQVRVTGRAGIAAIKTALYGMREGGVISEYDFRVSSQVANVICGGPVTPGTVVSEQYILDLEREGFLSLLGEPKTQARIRHMLKTGKPLRN